MKIINLSQFAKKTGFAAGDEIVSFGGFPFTDELDYLYYDNQQSFDAVINRNGEQKIIKVKKGECQPLGLDINFPEMTPIRCKNKCLFCFVDQLPENLRETLYIKDDDYRLSFISGCYVTLTNVSEEELERIIRLKLSPLYVSVHAFDDDVRLKLVANPRTLKLKDYMKRLGSAGIKMHTQLVIVPGLNDGEELEKSIRGLKSMEGVLSVAAVPVGLTSHRSGLPELNGVDKRNAADTVKLVEKLNCEFGGFCWCSDEYYIKAELPVKDYTYYGAFEQIENGVGLLADFYDNIDYSLSITAQTALKGKFAMITGVSFAPLLADALKKVTQKTGLLFDVYGIKNTFFGESVTVAGLVTAGDIINQASGVDCDVYVIPDNMLREFNDTFLDNVSIKTLEDTLKKPVITVRHNGSDLVEALIEFIK